MSPPRPTIAAVARMVCDYYDGADMTQTGGRSTGGNLHIVIDDGNWDDGSLLAAG